MGHKEEQVVTGVPESKVCTKCKADKPIKNFHKDSRTKIGYAYWCKACKLERDLPKRSERLEKAKRTRVERKQKRREWYQKALRDAELTWKPWLADPMRSKH